MEPGRKRRVIDASQNTRPTKRVDRRVSFSDALNNDVTMSCTTPTTTCAVVGCAKPNVVTPSNSFLELRGHVSSCVDTPDEFRILGPPDDTVSVGLTYSSSEPFIRESPTFDISVDSDESPQLAPCDVLDNFEDTIQTVPDQIVTGTKHVHAVRINATRTDPNRRWSAMSLIMITVLYVVARVVAPMLLDSVTIFDEDSIYVPGGGFSGFWYTLGRLSSIEDPLSKKYYCYSAGCLGAVTVLGNITRETAYDYASGAQKRWFAGDLSRYDVTKSFIDSLLYGSDEADAITPENLRPAFRDEKVLSTLQIITSKRNWDGGVKVAIRSPKDAEELKDMLLQTTWIPFAIARDLWHEEHMDGAFTLFEHPRCPTRLGYGFDLDIILNALNVNLSKDKVKLLWEKGLSKAS